MSINTPPQLRPMSAGDILDRAIRIYRQNFVQLVTIVAIVSVPLAVFQVIAALVTYPLGTILDPNAQINSGAFNTTRLLLGQGLLYLAGIVGAIAAVFQSGALTAFTAERFLGRSINVRQAYGRAFGRWLALLLAVFLIGLVNIAVFGILFGVFIVPFVGFSLAGTNLDSGASAVMGLLTLLLCCLIVPAFLVAIFLNTRWAFFIQAIVLENYNSTGGMGRSWKLVKGSFWRVALMLLVLVILVYAFSTGPILLLTLGATVLASPMLIAVVNSVLSTLINIILTPLQFATLTVLYYDLRIRKEGFDLEMQMANLPPLPVLPPAPKQESDASASPPPSDETPLDLPPLYSRDDSSQQ